VSLEEDDVGVGALVAAEEVVEAHFVQRRGRSEGRDVAADAFLGLVGAHHHGGGVPADEALDPALQVGPARHEHLFVGRDGIDVGRIGRERQLDAVLTGVDRQLAQQAGHLCGAAALQHIIKRVEPFARLDRIELRLVFRRDVSQNRSFPLVGYVGQAPLRL